MLFVQQPKSIPIVWYLQKIWKSQMYKNWESVLEALEYFFFYSEFYCSSTQDYSPLEICFALQVFDIFFAYKATLQKKLIN